MPESRTLRVMTYNLKYADDTPPNSWGARKNLMTEVITNESPDLIGTQEGLFRQLNELAAMLPDYGWIGLGREGGSQGEYMAIFYKKDRLEVLAYNHFWLSDTPSEIGSRTWGNICPRMVTWVRFLDKKTNQSFYHFNTHLDNYSLLARVEGAKLIVQKALELDTTIPIVLTGDFNESNHSESYKVIVEEGPFSDTWFMAEERINEKLGTFNDFSDPSGGKDRIDWILVRGSTGVGTSKIVGDCQEGKFPSDHFPIVVELQM
ncbi:endonuclease/exonuclease/phosphatase family protein [Neobacillus kokaensis]|uniref:Endonuclease n=1 Tax=Neobacillus kokaensis TaxID=2759023 RepID=A0ABQ3N5I0_9BACI|nr:endonuclease/exonuclease/phosphatase family protein [Neobacillus kokaensis]GHH97780.1 endonuclease [Neobacillus kokaensis]